MATQHRFRNWRRRIAILAFLVLLPVAAIYTFRGLPRVAADAMRNADAFELLSLNPERSRADADFHGFKVLGRIPVTDPATRKRLYDSLQSGARWNVPIPSLCFDPPPRHPRHLRRPNLRPGDLLRVQPG
jgi:hypothetical protein